MFQYKKMLILLIHYYSIYFKSYKNYRIIQTIVKMMRDKTPILHSYNSNN